VDLGHVGKNPNCKTPNFCAAAGNSGFTGDFGLQKPVAEAHHFATIFATVGSGVMNIGNAQVSTSDQRRGPFLRDAGSWSQGLCRP
jgi:hypothetical protein